MTKRPDGIARSSASATILDPGPLTTLQDLGRPGYGRWGVSVGGAADRGSMRLANRLVDNAETALALEVTAGPMRVSFEEPTLIAVTGACLSVTVRGRTEAAYVPLLVPAGEVMISVAAAGLRAYLAIRGGFAPTGSGGSAGRALGVGDRLDIDPSEPAGVLRVDQAPMPAWLSRDVRRPVVLRAMLGPRDGWFAPNSLAPLFESEYLVATDSDRVGLRLAGPPVGSPTVGSGGADMLSEPALRGAIEIPQDGQPIVFLADHPTICGYPIVAVLDALSADLAAQLRPGQLVRIRPYRLT